MWAFFLTVVKTIAINLAIAALTQAAALRKQGRAPRYSLSDFTYNTTDQSRALTRIFGRVPVTGNLTWWGNLRAREIKKKVRVAGVTVGSQSLGWEYSASLWLSLTGGNAERVRAIYYGDRLVWEGSLELSKTTATTLTVDKRWAEAEGAALKSGLAGTFTFWNLERLVGDATALPVDTFLQAQLGEAPPMYPNTCHCVFDGFLGIGPNIPSIRIVLEDHTKPVSLLAGRSRDITFPVSGSLSDGSVYSTVNSFVESLRNVNQSANPVFALAEISTKQDPSFGARFSPYLLDVDSIFKGALRVKEDGLGVDFPWEQTTSSEEQLNQLLLLINGSLDPDPQTGLLTLTLAREDDEVAFEFDASNIVRLGKFQRNVIAEAPNVFETRYADRDARFVEKTCTARNVAGVRAAGREIKLSQDFLGMSNRQVASKKVTALKASAVSSLGTLDFTGTVPGGTILRPGQRITVNHVEEGLLRLRITSARYGAYDSRQEVDIEAVEDVFRDGNDSLGTEDPGTSLPPDVVPTNALEASRVFRAPAAFNDGSNDQAVIMLAPSNTSQSAFRVEMAATSSATFDNDSAFMVEGSYGFAATGTTTGAVEPHANFAVQLSAASAAVVARNLPAGTTPYVCLGNPEGTSCVWIRATGISLNTSTNIVTVVCGGGHGIWHTYPLRFPAGTEAWLAYDYCLDPGWLQTTLTKASNNSTVAAQFAGAAAAYPWVFVKTGNKENPTPVKLSALSGTTVGGSGSPTIAARPWNASRTRLNGNEGAFAETDSLPLFLRNAPLTASWVNRTRSSRTDSDYNTSTSAGTETNSRTLVFIDTKPTLGSSSWVRRHTATLTNGESQTATLGAMDTFPTASGHLMRLIVRTEQQVNGQWVYAPGVLVDEDLVSASLGAPAGRARYYQLT